MKSPRYMLALVGVALGLLASRVPAARGAATIVAGPMVGHVSATTARLWMQITTAERVAVRTFDMAGNRPVGWIALDVEGPYPFIFDAPLSGLEPNHTYRIEIEFGGKPVKLPDPPVAIRTGPPLGEPDTFMLAFGSCFDPDLADRTRLFKAVTALHPRAFVFLGNSGYLPAKETDFPQTRRAAARLISDNHKRVRLVPELQALFRSTACYATWDDRDFGPPDADRSWVYSAESRVAFERYWANPDYGTPACPGVYCNFSIGDADVFLLDGRTYRDPAKDPQRQSMFGEGQLAWLKQALQQSRATFKVIAGATPFLADSAALPAWGDYRAEREEFLGWMFTNHISGVLFLSGGRRFGELTLRKPTENDVAQYPLYELTSSPLAYEIAPADDQAKPNTQRVGVAVIDLNFGSVEVSGPRDKRHVTLRLRDQSGNVKLEQVLLADQLRSQ